MFRMLLSLLVVLNIAAASSSDHKGLKGEPSSGIVSKSASTIELQATFLTEGYVTTASYVDSGCKALSSADSYLLNNCYKESGKYLKYTATATSIISTSYSDANCKTVLVAQIPSNYTNACADSKKKYISPTTKIPSITPVALQIYYPANDTKCALISYKVTTIGLDICRSNRALKISGNFVELYEYAKSDCSGEANKIKSSTIGACDSTSIFQVVLINSDSATALIKACFAGSETVTLESGKTKPISEVRAGDRVLAADASRRTLFSEVVFVPHTANTDKAVFSHITTTQGRDIKMTGSHIIPAGACGSTAPLPNVYASAVAVGDCIMTVSGMEKVSAVETVQGQGLYTIVTKDEYVVVNGIIASPFAYNHMLANLYYNIHRFVYACVPGVLTMPMVRSANEVLGLLIPLARMTA